MTDEEKYRIVGRTHVELKEAKALAALLRADIQEHATKLKEASDLLVHFLSDAVGVGPSGMGKPEYALHFLKGFLPAELQGKIYDYSRTLERIQRLEAQVKEF